MHHTKGTCNYCGAGDGQPCTVTLLNNETLSIPWSHRARGITPPKRETKLPPYKVVIFL